MDTKNEVGKPPLWAGEPGRRIDKTGSAVYRALASIHGKRLAEHRTSLAAAGAATSLAAVPQPDSPATLLQWRGWIDSAAFRTRFSDAALYRRDVPQRAVEQALFSMLEQNRVEALAARRYAGSRGNLAGLVAQQWARARPEVTVRGTSSAWLETFALLARVPLGAPLPPEVIDVVGTRWREWMTVDEVAALERLAFSTGDQATFATQALQLVKKVCARVSERETEPRDAGDQCHRDRPSNDPENQAEPGADLADDTREAGLRRALDSDEDHTYRVYTVEFDRVVSAEDLVTAEVATRRRAELEHRVGERLTGVARWVPRLQRHLLALQRRSWQFDRDEGELDPSRLTRIVTNPLESLVYKQESPQRFPDAVVALLVDNSGSMRGRPIGTAAVCAELLGRVLERCGVKFEVLGFTTGEWRGGGPFRQWVAAGRPENPGRLTALRHIVYKSADEPWRRAAGRMGILLESSLLKENVDGEALRWAHSRLQYRPEPRKILLVISDGAPLDEATQQANSPGYLDNHLRAVIADLEARSTLELAAIGIGHDVTRYYRRAVHLQNADALGDAIVSQLLALFARQPPTARAAA